MIVLTCVLTPDTGRREESLAAARELMKAAQDHEGLLGYLWTDDAATGDLVLVEVHRDERSVRDHVAESDVSRLMATGTLSDIRLLGDAPSDALLETLSAFGQYRLYPAI
jgi:quinol monooxygenase YgiN